MKAMILAAGFGTRLRPITDRIPKALVEHRGKPLILNVIDYLEKFGVTEFVVNIHHHHQLISQFFEDNYTDRKISLLHEEPILGTGGAIINASEFLNNSEYFIVMNVDIETDYNLQEALELHISEKPFASIVIQDRQTERKLSFDNAMKLTGRTKHGDENKFAFNGIHILSDKIFNSGYKREFLDIIDIYISETMKGETIKGINAGSAFFIDLGKPENLKSYRTDSTRLI
ncbi:nucleotidyltransferase family protein [Ignavibacteria bacterium CHB1]|jgi:Nucleoside-diphosphate-sugar pyrophosphorylase involved in lipopolysaccharide biosynthesis/translation initiation factor 2B, gamma/epsilon subunits (eIF-2Bgamma/eIF-2Bepsilon)|nr:MAG: nucleotidyltransferase family protein [Chlorobiota bacterium]KXK06227.1 MAG: nucleotidyl transferase [Chlorobi bacterium OLB4]MBV6399260.1 Bifunctional protein GlmU [Ignavibacteria bacterium]MCC6884933.1 NTP transferase domain-containing protein [Ignavibacteriales bacterium]MCE7953536.1 nucleotidyltransferase family protein [Chlorobi bacterium CHB7]MDL1887574.1 nucleotidyltransferase family protein [Ignavibacteria bacterium CHB1]OQY78459.1 MAG: hypothetical protein B6D43_03035 [Ignavi